MNDRKALVVCLSTLLSLLVGFGSLTAQTTSTITGNVTDATTGGFLPGANVILQGTGMGAATDREGNYRIPNVPPGNYKLVVNYLGYEEFSTDISVAARTTVTQDAALQVSYLEMGEVIVEGLREGQSKALSQQRAAVNIKNVVAQEQIQQFPDENTADVLQRLPGVYISRSLGQGRYVLIRGTDPRLNQITVNGEQMATNRRQERFPQLDIIGASQLASVEVVKAPTPDMDAEAIGGTVNLVTRSAFDYTGGRLDVSLSGGYAEIDQKGIFQAKASYSNRLLPSKKLGFSITGNWDRKARGTDNTEKEWDNAEDINGNEIPFALVDMDLRDYQSTFSRYGLGATLEYRPNETNQWFIRGLFSRFTDDTWRGRMRLRVDRGDYLNPEGTLTSRSRIAREHQWRIEELVQHQYQVGGIHQFGDMQLDYSGNFSYASEQHIPQYESGWQLDERVNLALDLANTDYPKWDLTNLDNNYQFDASHYEFDEVDYREQDTYNRNVNGGANFKMPFTLGSVPSELKIGGKVTFRRKFQDDTRSQYSWEGQDNLFLDQLASDYDNLHFLNGNYRFGPIADQDRFLDFFTTNQESFQGELDYVPALGEDYDAHENIYAYYAMATFNIGNVTLLGGVRHEFTHNDYDGTEVFFDENGDFSSSQKVTNKRNYNKFLPMVHLKYRLTPITNLRLAFTEGLSRPNYFDLAPYRFVEPDGEQIQAGNPDLKPTTSRNFDLMFEHYFQRIGIASAGFFYKRLSDIIFTTTFNIVGGVFDGFEQEQPVNGGDAKLYGFELNWQQELTFLPGFLNGFGIYANYTHTWSDAEDWPDLDFLPGNAGDVGNASVSYEKYGLSLRLSANYQDDFILEVGQDADRHVWRANQLRFDFSGAYAITPRVSAFFDWINITDEAEVEYLGVRERPTLIELYSWEMRAGIRFNR